MASASSRKPAVAGQFYPKDPVRLRDDVERFLTQAHVDSAPERVQCLIAPHAGYVYSGPTAAHAYARVRGNHVKRVVLLGCSHHFRFEGASIYAEGAFETPLGAFPIDAPLAKELADRIGSYSQEPHLPEHSLEVQLPFLSEVVGRVPIVPILFGSTFGDWHLKFAEALAEVVEDGDLIVVSTDLSHYLTEGQANIQDRRSLDTLLTKDIKEVLAGAEDGRCAMCGVTAVAAAMPFCLAKNATEWTVLDYRTSARASGNTERVVGYAAVSMERPQ